MGESFRLFHYWRSSCSWRVRWALHIKNLDVEYISVNLLEGEQASPSHLERNPMGLVPALEVLENGERKALLTESLPIMEWLEETHPANPLLPKNPLEKFQSRRLAEVINAGTQPLQNLGVMKVVSEDPEDRKSWSRIWIHRGLEAYEAMAQESAGKFSVGDEITMADLCLIPQVYNAKRFDLDLGEYPTVHGIYQKALETDGYLASQPDRFQP